ncbi:MAG: YdcF family protein [Thermoanaerobaculia bacterium]|nr:YdcF family protein [Thermoanaerobaculia bacterium]
MRPSRFLKRLFLPPAGLLILGCVAWLGLGSRWDPWAKAGLAFSLLGLYVLSTPLVGLSLLRRVETQYPQLRPDELAESFSGRSDVAIVVLDAGRVSNGTDSEADDAPSSLTLERLALAARAHRATGLPILVSGNGAGPLMADSLREDFRVPVRWIEPISHDTAANATRSAAILQAEGFDHVLLVTHAWHMPRSAEAFRRTGLGVTPVPTAITGTGRQELGLISLLPSEFGMSSSYWYYHETVGRLWYRLRHRPTTESAEEDERSGA